MNEKEVDYRLFRNAISDIMISWKNAPKEEYRAMEWIASAIYREFSVRIKSKWEYALIAKYESLKKDIIIVVNVVKQDDI